MPKLSHNDAPLNPYRVLWDLQRSVDVANTIITHDAGSPRDQLSPFWRARTPHSYIGWGIETQHRYSLGSPIGGGDAALGFAGMYCETGVRAQTPILSILLNNYSMACELPIMKVSTEKFR